MRLFQLTDSFFQVGEALGEREQVLQDVPGGLFGGHVALLPMLPEVWRAIGCHLIVPFLGDAKLSYPKTESNKKRPPPNRTVARRPLI